MKYIEALIDGAGAPPQISVFTAVILVLAAAWLGNFIVKQVLLRRLGLMMGLLMKGRQRDENIHRAVSRLANIVPVLIVMAGAEWIGSEHTLLQLWVYKIGGACLVFVIGMALSALLDALNGIYSRRPEGKEKSIKGYVQVGKIILFIVGAVLMISSLAGSPPLALITGLGAMAAVLMLIFQDTILSFVASVQLTSNDIVRVGDWIEMPNLNADGDVIDIALHTIKVQNWDKTITTVPTRRLITDPVKNWRGMRETGGRRIKRPLFLDQNSIGFLKEEELERLQCFALLKEYLRTKADELEEWNRRLGEAGHEGVNKRRMTNIGTFRAYVLQYLKTHPGVHQGLTIMVRQLSPTPQGLPLELYCFTNSTAWAVYEGVQSDIFDHLYSILPEFGLRVFQSPGGEDLKALRDVGLTHLRS